MFHIVLSGYNYYSTKSENKAFELLNKAMFNYNSAVKDSSKIVEYIQNKLNST